MVDVGGKSQSDPVVAICVKCQEVVDQSEFVICNGCKFPCHISCAPFSYETWKKNKNQCKMNYQCEKCKPANPNKRKKSTGDDDLQDLLAAAVEQANKKVMAKLEEIESKNTLNAQEVRSAMETLNNKLDSTNTKLVSMDQEINKLKESETLTQKEFERHDYIISTLQDRINNLEQYSREKNVIVSGVVEKLNIHDGNIYDIIQGVARSMNVTLDKQDIVSAHPLRNKRGYSSIIIVFRNKEIKKNFMRNKKNASLMLQGATHKVYINPQLTEYYSNLLYQTKQIAREMGAKFVWYDNCKCLVRKTEGSPAIAIRKHEDLKYLREKNQYQQDDLQRPNPVENSHMPIQNMEIASQEVQLTAGIHQTDQLSQGAINADQPLRQGVINAAQLSQEVQRAT